MIEPEITFSSKLWVYSGKAAWYFLTLPEEDAHHIRFFRQKQVGFGSVPVSVTIGNTTWKTSLFPDKKANSYILPIKKEVRSSENIDEGDEVKATIVVLG